MMDEKFGDFSNTQHCRVYSSELLSCVAICRSKIYSILIFIIIMIETVLFILMELLTEFPVFEVLNYFYLYARSKMKLFEPFVE